MGKFLDSFLTKKVQKAAVVAKETVEVEVKKNVDDKINTVFDLVMTGVAIGAAIKYLMPKTPKTNYIPETEPLKSITIYGTDEFVKELFKNV